MQSTDKTILIAPDPLVKHLKSQKVATRLHLYTMLAQNFTSIPSPLLQLITIPLEGNQPATKLLPEDEGTLDGISELRIEFRDVSDPDATTFEQHVLGCIKGRFRKTLLVLTCAFKTLIQSISDVIISVSGSSAMARLLLRNAERILPCQSVKFQSVTLADIQTNHS